MPSTSDADVRRVRLWLRLSGGLSLLAGLACLVSLVASERVSSPARVLLLLAGIGLTVYGIGALATVVGPGSAER
jgi:uncharacterized membrane protein HdeD (DUF308 family)